MSMSKTYIIYTDGGSRRNPGPAASGYTIEATDGSFKKEYGEYLGIATNNEAEYRAVIFAFKKIKQLAGSDRAGDSILEFHVDSELLVKQLNGEYKIKDDNIKNFFMEIWNLKLDFKEVTFKHIFREENKGADRLVNRALDREGSKLDL